MLENSDDDCDFKEIAQLNYTRISSTLSKVGYTEGITDGRESVFQNGFDQGYADGLRTGFEIAKYKSFAKLLPVSEQKDKLSNEIKQLNTKNISHPKSPSHFKLNESSGQLLAEVSKNQNKYTDEFINKIQEDFPIINSLLC